MEGGQGLLRDKLEFTRSKLVVKMTMVGRGACVLSRFSEGLLCYLDGSYCGYQQQA